MAQTIPTKVHKVEETGVYQDGVEVLEVSLMVQVSDRVATKIRGLVYGNHVELKTDIGKYQLNLEEIKEEMAGIAHQWDNTFNNSQRRGGGCPDL